MGMHVAGPLGSQGLVLAARLLVGAVLLMAGGAKLPQRRTFARDVQQYRLLPGRVATGYAVVLPCAELVAAVSLLSGVLVAFGAGLAILLFISFAGAAISAIARRLSLSCACFGLLYREKIGWATVARDAILLALALEALLFDRGRFSLPATVAHLGRPANSAAFAATIFVAGASLLPAIQAIHQARRVQPMP